MDFGQLLIISISAIFINNFVLMRFLGICPYIGVSKQLDSAIGMGFAVIFVMALASLATWAVWTYLLDPFSGIWGTVDLRFLRTVSFILVIASLVQFVEMVIRKTAPGLYQALGIYLPLITTNCAVLGVAVLNIDQKLNLIASLVQGTTAGIGFTLALILMAGIREKFELSDIPKPLQGIPIALIMAGLMGIAFLGFAGLKIGG
jgi:electron transport complex protein RnfA